MYQNASLFMNLALISQVCKNQFNKKYSFSDFTVKEKTNICL
jgi:hypothetical protein